MESVKKKIKNKMARKMLYEYINEFVSKHPKYSHSKVLAALDRWSFRHSPTVKEWQREVAR